MSRLPPITEAQFQAALQWFNRINEQPGQAEGAAFKRWLLADPAHPRAWREAFFADATLPSIALALAYAGDARPELLGHRAFPSMNRVMHLRPGWAFPLAGPVKGYINAFAGYGQSMIDYNYFQRSVGAGVIVKY